MDPESDPKDPGRLYAKALKDKIVRDATARSSSWAGGPDPGDGSFRVTPRLVVGLAVMLVVFAFNMVGDGLRDALDPRLRGTF